MTLQIPWARRTTAIDVKDDARPDCAADGTGECACGVWDLAEDVFEWRPIGSGWEPVSLPWLNAGAEGAALCVHCGSSIRRYERDARVWVHARTNLPRCVTGSRITVATPQAGPVSDERRAG